MKKLLTLFAFVFISTFAHANTVEDSLIANIGKKAKVIFYAENKADLNEIAKYDLNKLFAEVRKRSEKNFSLNEEVTLKEADELKNREVNTTVTPRKWLKNMNLNLFVGASISESPASFRGETIDYSPRGIYQKNYGLQGRTIPMIGLGAFFDKKLNKSNRFDFSIRYGAGFDFITSRIKATNFGSSFSYLNPQNGFRDNFVDSLFSSSKSEYFNTSSLNFYTQLMPTITLLNSKGEKTFSFGVGLKSSISLNNFRRIDGSGYWSGLGETLFLSNEPTMNFRYRTFQTAWVANIGYKSINLFIQMQPNIANVRQIVRSKEINTYTFGTSQASVNTYTIGLRFGK
ncbi:MAG: hypothetical protein U5M51_16565 [Emticicia sp.]|nr:hypothetical protein [Emticicia sp.]